MNNICFTIYYKFKKTFTKYIWVINQSFTFLCVIFDIFLQKRMYAAFFAGWVFVVYITHFKKTKIPVFIHTILNIFK